MSTKNLDPKRQIRPSSHYHNVDGTFSFFLSHSALSLVNMKLLLLVLSCAAQVRAARVVPRDPEADIRATRALRRGPKGQSRRRFQELQISTNTTGFNYTDINPDKGGSKNGGSKSSKSSFDNCDSPFGWESSEQMRLEFCYGADSVLVAMYKADLYFFDQALYVANFLTGDPDRYDVLPGANDFRFYVQDISGACTNEALCDLITCEATLQMAVGQFASDSIDSPKELPLAALINLAEYCGAEFDESGACLRRLSGGAGSGSGFQLFCTSDKRSIPILSMGGGGGGGAEQGINFGVGGGAGMEIVLPSANVRACVGGGGGFGIDKRSTCPAPNRSKGKGGGNSMNMRRKPGTAPRGIVLTDGRKLQGIMMMMMRQRQVQNKNQFKKRMQNRMSGGKGGSKGSSKGGDLADITPQSTCRTPAYVKGIAAAMDAVEDCLADRNSALSVTGGGGGGGGTDTASSPSLFAFGAAFTFTVGPDVIPSSNPNTGGDTNNSQVKEACSYSYADAVCRRAGYLSNQDTAWELCQCPVQQLYNPPTYAFDCLTGTAAGTPVTKKLLRQNCERWCPKDGKVTAIVDGATVECPVLLPSCSCRQ